jgi:hypothetical protein
VIQARPLPDSNQMRAGWPWLRAQAQHHALRTAAASPQPWNCPCESFVHEGLGVWPIRSVLELREEAMAMRNCLADYAAACVARVAQPFSVRDPEGKRIACVMLERRRPHLPWSVSQVAGPMNHPPDEKAISAARAACERCNLSEESGGR